mmetsp:Transcript_132474/g.424047  ORF Transcript_132474/g.424047 Transcript_132474/m.424047 type:complete len:483 (-) Transcript_132474:305-1753(-)
MHLAGKLCMYKSPMWHRPTAPSNLGDDDATRVDAPEVVEVVIWLHHAVAVAVNRLCGGLHHGGEVPEPWRHAQEGAPLAEHEGLFGAWLFAGPSLRTQRRRLAAGRHRHWGHLLARVRLLPGTAPAGDAGKDFLQQVLKTLSDDDMERVQFVALQSKADLSVLVRLHQHDGLRGMNARLPLRLHGLPAGPELRAIQKLLPEKLPVATAESQNVDAFGNVIGSDFLGCIPIRTCRRRSLRRVVDEVNSSLHERRPLFVSLEAQHILVPLRRGLVVGDLLHHLQLRAGPAVHTPRHRGRRGRRRGYGYTWRSCQAWVRGNADQHRDARQVDLQRGQPQRHVPQRLPQRAAGQGGAALHRSCEAPHGHREHRRADRAGDGPREQRASDALNGLGYSLDVQGQAQVRVPPRHRAIHVSDRLAVKRIGRPQPSDASPQHRRRLAQQRPLSGIGGRATDHRGAGLGDVALAGQGAALAVLGDGGPMSH